MNNRIYGPSSVNNFPSSFKPLQTCPTWLLRKVLTLRLSTMTRVLYITKKIHNQTLTRPLISFSFNSMRTTPPTQRFVINFFFGSSLAQGQYLIELVEFKTVVSDIGQRTFCSQRVSVFHALPMPTPYLLVFRTFSSSAPAGVLPQLAEEFHLSRLVGTLTISLFVAGYCVGPLLWAPLSEQVTHSRDSPFPPDSDGLFSMAEGQYLFSASLHIR
jgi:hypothetical protein